MVGGLTKILACVCPYVTAGNPVVARESTGGEEEGITEIKKWPPPRGGARDMGGGSTSASNAPVFFVVLGMFHGGRADVSHAGLPLGDLRGP